MWEMVVFARLVFLSVVIHGQVIVSGISGEETTTMVNRLDQDLNTFKDISKVVILGGTNDLGFHQANDIFDRLLQMYNNVLSRGLDLVVVTVPDSKIKVDWYLEKRFVLNTFIREFAETRNNVLCVDIENLIPYGETDFWDDHLHFGEKGYDQMALHIFNEMHPVS
eukprot:TRINITY_DN1219_c0_g2_i6.p1 TRINITY_DN1219_c0_g2~~TRINITY_DN1219_c0_g2_i6.p1  ORF type:complete len:166 (-),score=35.13 TRINITY_DN1219_c0_g2_i6:45-542(-)